jgi:hypothetical protein
MKLLRYGDAGHERRTQADVWRDAWRMPRVVLSPATPAGVGLGMTPEPTYLQPGDVVDLGIDGLGCARQHVVAYREV